MKILFALVVSVSALFLGGCAIDRPLISDEEYNAYHGPAPNSPDPMAQIPQPSNRPTGW